MRVLVQFVLRHLDFRMPELDSLLEMHGLQPASLYSQYVPRSDVVIAPLRCSGNATEMPWMGVGLMRWRVCEQRGRAAGVAVPGAAVS